MMASKQYSFSFRSKRKRDRSKKKSIEPKCDNQFLFYGFRTSFNPEIVLQVLQIKSNQNNNNFLFVTCTKHVNKQRIGNQILA